MVKLDPKILSTDRLLAPPSVDDYALKVLRQYVTVCGGIDGIEKEEEGDGYRLGYGFGVTLSGATKLKFRISK